MGNNRNYPVTTRKVLVFGLLAAILFIRKTDAFTYPQFWAEDGTVFFVEQHALGYSALFQPYGGYMHLVPRIMALFAHLFFPYAAAPFIYNYGCLILTFCVVGNVYSSRFIMPGKDAFALATVLIPHYTNEIFMNLTNLQWLLAILLVITLLKESPDKKYGTPNHQVGFDFITLFFCGLTGPFIIFLVPFFLWNSLRSSGSYSKLVSMFALGIGSVQACYLRGMLMDTTAAWHFARVITPYSAVIIVKLFGNLFFGTVVPYKLPVQVMILLFLCFVFFFSYLIYSVDSETRFKVLVLLGFSIVLLIASLYRSNDEPWALYPAQNAPRYFYLPYLFITWSLTACAQRAKLWASLTAKLCLAMILVSALTSGFHSAPLPDYHWNYYSARIDRDANLTVPINPRGWFMKFNVK